MFRPLTLDLLYDRRLLVLGRRDNLDIQFGFAFLLDALAGELVCFRVLNVFRDGLMVLAISI